MRLLFVSLAASAVILGCSSSSSSSPSSTPPPSSATGADGGASADAGSGGALPEAGSDGAAGSGSVVGSFTTSARLHGTLRASSVALAVLEDRVTALDDTGAGKTLVTGTFPALDGAGGLLYVDAPSGSPARVCRATLPDGALDASFGTSGCTPLPVSYLATAVGVAPLPGGGVVAVLNPDCSNGCDAGKDGFMLVRLDARGAVDTSFGASGVVYPNLMSEAQALSFGVQSSGAIVVSMTSGSFQLALVRLDRTGALDKTFGTAGLANAPGAGRYLFVLPDDRVVLGSTFNGMDEVERWTKDGAADATFAGGGRFALSALRDQPSGTRDVIAGLALDATGRVYVAGHAITEDSGTPTFSSPFVARLGAEGAVDVTFEHAGFAAGFAGLTSDGVATGVGTDASGRILLGLENETNQGHFDVVRIAP